RLAPPRRRSGEGKRKQPRSPIGGTPLQEGDRGKESENNPDRPCVALGGTPLCSTVSDLVQEQKLPKIQNLVERPAQASHFPLRWGARGRGRAEVAPMSEFRPRPEHVSALSRR